MMPGFPMMVANQEEDGLPVIILTAASAGGNTGYIAPDFGSISAEPVPGMTLTELASNISGLTVPLKNPIKFSGDQAVALAAYGGIKIDGGARIPLSAWIYDGSTWTRANRNDGNYWGFSVGVPTTIQLVP